MAKANERKTSKEEHCLQMERASVEEISVKEEVTQLKALLLNRDREKVPP